MPTINIQVARFRTKKQDKLIAMLNDKKVLKEANTIIKDEINKFVPMKTGALRSDKHIIVTHKSITWGKGLKYARYQYGGEVYGPNLPGLENGSPAWRSRKGRKKYPTGRELGKFGMARLYPRWSKNSIIPKTPIIYGFGYTTPGTHHHWDEYFKYGPKMRANLEITRLLKRECKARGLKV